MKKILALILATIMCLSLFAACGGGDTKATATPAPETTAPDATEDPTSGSDISASEPPASNSDLEESDMVYVMGKGTLLIGITIYEPMNYYDDNGDLTGFDTEFATLVCERIGVTPEFVEIDWSTKEIELAAKSIDCIWNGMTINPDREAAMSISLPYVKNAQVVVAKAGSGITSTADLIGKTVVAEAGSAGEIQIIGSDDSEPEENLAQAEYVSMGKQTDCLLEVKAGTAHAGVLDWTLARAMVGEGTDFADLEIVDGLELAAEEYGIAFRKGSDVTEEINKTIEDMVADGTLRELAEKYGLSLAPSIDK